MGKGLGKDRRKEVVPVLLTGKTWVPSAVPPARQPIQGMTIALCLFLGAIVGWFLLSSRNPRAVSGIPEPVATASTPVISSSPEPLTSIGSAGQVADATIPTMPPHIPGALEPMVSIIAGQPPIGTEPVLASPSTIAAAAEISLPENSPASSVALVAAGVPRNPFPDPLAWMPRSRRVGTSITGALPDSSTEIGKTSDSVSSDAISLSPVTETEEQEIAGVPVMQQKSLRLVGLRPVLVADGWDLTWENRRKKVIGSRKNGDSLEITSGARFVVLNGKTVRVSAKTLLAKNGQLFVSLDVLNTILGNRLSFTEEPTGASTVNVRLAGLRSPDKRDAPPLVAAAEADREISQVKIIRQKGQILVSLRQVLEADGWKVHWMGANKGVVCRKADDHILVVGPGKTTLVWDMEPLISRPAPQVVQGRMFVATKALETILKKRLQVDVRNSARDEATIRLSEV